MRPTWFHSSVSPARAASPPVDPALAALYRVAAGLGATIREERRRRLWSLRQLAERARLSVSHVHGVEAGRPVSLETYARLAQALGLRPEFDLVDPRRHLAVNGHGNDFVHAAMGDIEVGRLRGHGRRVALDEPYQHYQFAGRADVVAWDPVDRALLHLENRTAFPDLQAALGAYNAKRRYFGAELARRLGVNGGWRSETHAMVGLWSRDVLHTARIRSQSFAAVCPDPADGFAAWWTGQPPPAGVTSTFVLLDPTTRSDSRRRIWIDRTAMATARPRVTGYREAAEALRARDRG